MDTTHFTKNARYFDSLEDLSYEAFQVIRDRASKATRDGGLFTITLSGGNSPRGLYRRFAQPSLTDEIDWERVHLFWGDERCVPPDHTESNYRMAYEDFISKIPIPAENVHRMPVENRTAEEAARLYETIIKDYFTCRVRSVFPSVQDGFDSCYPRFDIILLGVGKDGHTAGLFPNSPNLRETTRWVVSEPAPEAEPRISRISLTLPIINSARTVLFIVTGEGKRKVIRTILDRPAYVQECYPAAMVKPENEVMWFLDEKYK